MSGATSGIVAWQRVYQSDVVSSALQTCRRVVWGPATAGITPDLEETADGVEMMGVVRPQARRRQR